MQIRKISIINAQNDLSMNKFKSNRIELLSGVQKRARYFRKKRRDFHGDALRANICAARYHNLIY